MRARALAALLPLAAAGSCIDAHWHDPVTADEVVTGATLRTKVAGDTAFADGRTRLIFSFDVATDSGLDPMLTATLQLAGGGWVLPDGNSTTTKTVNVTTGHLEAELTTGTAAGSLVATATVKTFTREATIDLVPLTLADAITSLATTTAAPVADGTTPIVVHLCTSPELVRDPMAQATLRTSDGTWIGSNAGDAKAVTVNLSTACIDGSLIPGVTPGPIQVSATVYRFTQAIAIDLAPAALDQVVCSVMGGIANGAGTLSVSARLVGHNGGKPSLGTSVAYDAQLTPGTAAGYFTQPVALLDSGTSVSSQFVTFGYPTRITLTATATPAGGTAVTCPPISVQGAPPPP